FGIGRLLPWAASATLSTRSGRAIHSRSCEASEYCVSCRSAPTRLALSPAPQEKLPESPRLFDLSKHRLHDRLAQRVHRRSHLGFQLSLPPLDSAGVFR